jgi:hypothetical protein
MPKRRKRQPDPALQELRYGFIASGAVIIALTLFLLTLVAMKG